MKNIGFILMFALLIMMAVMRADAADDRRDVINTISHAITNLDNQDANIREMSTKVLIAQGDTAIPYLRNVFRRKRHMEHAVAFDEVIKILEKIGTADAVNELLSVIGDNGRMLGPDPNVLMKSNQRIMNEYPAYASIVRIGDPAVCCISIKVIDEEQRQSINKFLYLRALMQIGGATAKHILEKHVESLESRLYYAKRALQFIETNTTHESVGVQGNPDQEIGEKPKK